MEKNRRIFYHYQELEETAAGMWRRINGDERRKYIEAAADLMRCPDEFLEAMRNGILAWPKSCAAAFTAENVNQIAFLGHVGCCVALGSPEECTRIGWHDLSRSEQDEANRVAAIALAEWHKVNAIHQDQGSLF